MCLTYPYDRLPNPHLLDVRRETIPFWVYGPSEMAANGLTLVDVPTGFTCSAITPYDLSAGNIPIEATVAHLPNKYCTAEWQALGGFCSIPYDDFIVS